MQQYAEFQSVAARVDEENLIESLDKLLRDIKPLPKFQKGFVNLMSIHKSKGLQAETVFVNALVDGVLPNKARGVDTLEAQRRLLFVGMTRALRSLYLISPVEWDGKSSINWINRSSIMLSKRRSGTGRHQVSWQRCWKPALPNPHQTLH